MAATAPELTLTLKEVVPLFVGLLGVIGWLVYEFIVKDMREDLKKIASHITTCQTNIKAELDNKVDWATFNTHKHPVDGPPLRG